MKRSISTLIFVFGMALSSTAAAQCMVCYEELGQPWTGWGTCQLPGGASINCTLGCCPWDGAVIGTPCWVPNGATSCGEGFASMKNDPSRILNLTPLLHERLVLESSRPEFLTALYRRPPSVLQGGYLGTTLTKQIRVRGGRRT